MSRSQHDPEGLRLTYGYDKFGNLLVQGYPGGFNVNYAPNALGQATQAGIYATAVTYHPNGAIAGFTYGNGIAHSMTQNTRQLPLRSRDSFEGTSVLDDGYDYDRNGNVLAISDGTAGGRGDRDMAYNSMNQLIEATSATMFGGTIKYTYDVLDNIATLVGPGRNLRYCYNARNQLEFIRASALNCTTGAATTALAYDWQGNVASKNNVAYEFDFGNRLRSVADGAMTTTYVYDAAGRRVRDITGASKYSLYTQAGQLAYTADGRKRENANYVYLNGSLVATSTVPFGGGTATVEYQHTDALGTPVAVTNASKAVIQRSEYEPYGAVLNRPIQDAPGFTGHVEDAVTGLTYMQQRYYDPQVGRFLSVDPVTAYEEPGINFNRYWYANNSPYAFFDPDGRATYRVVALDDKKQNTVVTDGKGGLRPHLGDADGQGPVVKEGIRRHEQDHIKTFSENCDKTCDVANGQPEGLQLRVEGEVDAAGSEVSATQVELDYLGAEKDKLRNKDQKTNVENRIETMEDYKDKNQDILDRNRDDAKSKGA